MDVTKALKTGNSARFAGILFVNLLIFSGITTGKDLTAITAPEYLSHLRSLLPVGVFSVVAGILTNLLPPHFKACIIFRRLNDPLPGCRAFSHFVDADSRIDRAALERLLGAFPTLPKEQNALWYKLYRGVKNEPAVSHAHGQFLLYRDFATMIFLISLILIPSAWLVTHEWSAVLLTFAILLIQLGVTVSAAQNSGDRFVCNVLAIHASTNSALR